MIFSKLSLFFCYVVVIVTAFFYYPKWEQSHTESTLSYDVSGYYLYLPAIFIYQDVKKLDFLPHILEKYRPTESNQQSFLHESSGNQILKYSVGQAIMMSPFFLVGHLFATVSNTYEADGFSYPYQKSIGVGMLLYMILGLWVLRIFLLKYFRDKTVGIFLLLLVLGTNYLNYSAIDLAHTHNALFCLYAVLLLSIDNFYKKPSFKNSLIIGLLCGLLSLIRPTEIISVLIALLWGISNFPDIRRRFVFIIKNLNFYLAAGGLMMVVGASQLVYWKYVSGEWLVYSYENQGFSWFSPHIKNFNFSFCCGWLLYTPMMLLFFPSVIIYFIYKKRNFGVLAFLLLNYYIVMSWDVWDFGGYSGRAMVQSYAVMSIPFCFMIESIEKRGIFKYFFYLVVFFFIYYNIWWTHQIHLGELNLFRPSKEYYYATLLKWDADEYDHKLMDTQHSYRGKPRSSKLIYFNDFEDFPEKDFIEDGIDGKSLILDSTRELSPLIKIERKEAFQSWIRVSADYRINLKEWNTWQQSQVVLQYQDSSGQVVQENSLRIQRYLNQGQTLNVFIDSRPPRTDWEYLYILFIHYQKDKPLWVDNLKVETFDD